MKKVFRVYLLVEVEADARQERGFTRADGCVLSLESEHDTFEDAEAQVMRRSYGDLTILPIYIEEPWNFADQH